MRDVQIIDNLIHKFHIVCRAEIKRERDAGGASFCHHLVISNHHQRQIIAADSLQMSRYCTWSRT